MKDTGDVKASVAKSLDLIGGIGKLANKGDMGAIDVEGLKILLSYRARNKLPENPWDAPQIATALRHGLGCKQGEYRVSSG